MMTQILPLDPARYAKHPIHGPDRIWTETNCYVDLWVELLHAWGFEPRAGLAFTLAIDFEGDQWTFFKFPLADLYALYGLDVQELAIWRPITLHIDEQIRRGHPVLVELDSFYLPDTVGTVYRREHTKSTVAINAIDIPSRHLDYFHNQGFYRLEGDDFTDVFRLAANDPAHLPPYVEFVKPNFERAPRGESLAAKSLVSLRRQIDMLPADNPFVPFKSRLEADLPWLANESLETFHRYSFATLRQFGSCYELAATYLQWLGQAAKIDLDAAARALTNIATEAKTLQFQLARAMMRKKPLDLAGVDVMAGDWQTAMEGVRRIGR